MPPTKRLKPDAEWWQEKDTPLRVDGRLTGPEADTVRAAAHGGDGVLDALRRVITIAARSDADLRASQARERALQAHVDTLQTHIDTLQATITDHRAAYTSMAKSYAALVNYLRDLATIQANTAKSAANIAADNAAVRSSIIQAVSGIASTQAHIAETLSSLDPAVHFLNGLIDGLPPALLDPTLLRSDSDVVDVQRTQSAAPS